MWSTTLATDGVFSSLAAEVQRFGRKQVMQRPPFLFSITRTWSGTFLGFSQSAYAHEWENMTGARDSCNARRWTSWLVCERSTILSIRRRSVIAVSVQVAESLHPHAVHLKQNILAGRRYATMARGRCSLIEFVNTRMRLPKGWPGLTAESTYSLLRS